MGKSKRRVKQHEDLRNDLRYKQRIEENIKVRKRKVEEEEAEQEVRNYTKS